MDSEDKQAHALRCNQIRARLKEIGVRNPMYYFAKMFPEYDWGNDRKSKEFNRIDNLWHGKIIDKTFLNQMESFLTAKESEFG